MIDTSAILSGPVEVGAQVYVGPYCVLGFPASVVLPSENGTRDANFRPSSRGVTIGAQAQLMSHVVISEGTVIDDDVWCDHHTYIGCDTRIAQGAQILYGAKVYHRVSIGRGAWIGGFTCNDAIIEDATVVLGQLVHKFRDATVGVPEKSPIIRKSAFVGMNAFIIGGIEVGCGAYIAGGAVLTRSAKPGRLYTGAPAKEVGRAPSGFSFPKNNIP